MAQAAPTMQEPNQYSSVEKTRTQANDMLNQHLPGQLQKNNFGVQPAAINTHGNHWHNSFWGCFSPPELCKLSRRNSCSRCTSVSQLSHYENIARTGMHMADPVSQQAS